MKVRGVGFAVLVVAVAFSGCTASTHKGLADDADGGSILIREGDGKGLVLQKGTGAIFGFVQDDIGVVVPTARAELVGTDFVGYSNKEGQFRILNVTAGTYTISVDHRDYGSAETEVIVEVGQVIQVTVTLVPKVAAGAGYRPHLHDLWNGRTEVTVLDRAFEWHEPYDDSGPYSESFGRYYDTTTLVFVHPCVWTDKKDEVYFNQRQVWFDDPAQLIMAGTSRIEVTLTWTQQDYALDELMMAYRSADTVEYVETPMIKKGEPYSFEITGPQADSSHQTFSLWDFWVCTGGADFDARPFVGSFQLTMKIFRGLPILPEAAHPYFWQNGTQITVVPGAQRNFSAGSYALSRSQFGNGAFVIRPGENVLIPPGTERIEATLEWAYEQAVNDKPWSMTYRPANVYPFESKDPGQLTKPTATATTETSRTYVIPLKDAETDAFYQKKSNWVFFLNLEGEEAEWKFVNPCPCAVQVTLTVKAFEKENFEAQAAAPAEEPSG